MTDQDHVVAALRTDEGLMGLCLKTGKTWCYPDDKDTARIIRNYDHRRITMEIVAPVFYSNSPTAVLLIDFFAGETELGSISRFRSLATQAAREITGILEGFSKNRQGLRARILHLVEECKSNTSSVRGYLAIKGLDGKLEYITTESDKPIFLALNQTEGLCGRVFREGEPINEGNVWKAQGYVASDMSVQSECIFPIKTDDGTVVAVLNMESNLPENYTKNRENVVRAYASQLNQAVVDYRLLGLELPDSIDVQHAYVSDFIEQATNQFRRLENVGAEGIQIGITEFITDKLVRLFKADKPVIWDNPNSPPVEMKDIRWEQRMEEGCRIINGGESAKRYVVYSPLRIDGLLKAVIGFVSAKQPPEIAQHIAEQFCRIGSSIAESTIEKNRSALFERLVRDLLKKRDRAAISDVARTVPSIVDCDHCTLLGVKRIGKQDVLVPLASSSENVFSDYDSQLFYRMGPDAYDGFTGYVGKTGELLFRFPPEDSETIEPAAEGQPPWARKTSEVREELAAIIILPIVNPATKRVIGALRVIRTKRHRKALTPLDSQFLERLETICAALGELFSRSGLIPSYEEVGRRELPKTKQRRVFVRQKSRHARRGDRTTRLEH